MRARQLFLDQEIGFGKFSKQTPLRIWTGSPGYISPELADILTFELKSDVNFQGETKRLRDVLSQADSDTFKFSLPKGSIIGMLGRENALDVYERSKVEFIKAYRGEPSYIEWLIRSTDHYFNPTDLEVLNGCQVFKHGEIKVKRYLLNSEEQILEFGFIPSTELYQPTIRKELIELNQSKFNDNNFDDDSSEGDDWGPDDDWDPGRGIDPDNPFGVSPEEAETIYWNTH